MRQDASFPNHIDGSQDKEKSTKKAKTQWLNSKILNRHLVRQKIDTPMKKIIYIGCILVCIMIFLPFYPGVFGQFDEAGYWHQASGLDPLTDWHSPFFIYFWRFIGVFSGLFLFTLLSYWIGLGITFYALFDRLTTRLLALFLTGFFPSNLPFIFWMIVDSFTLATLIMSISLLLIYFFRIKKSIFLWASLIFTWLCIGSKQDIVIYILPILFAQAYLILKHSIKQHQMPSLHYKKFTHVLWVFLILLGMMYGSITYINKQIDMNTMPFWKGQLGWDLMGTSIYAHKNLYYPNLIKPEYKNKITSSELYGYMQKEFDPAWNKNICIIGTTNKILMDFDNLTKMQKVFVLNQLASNPIAYLFHRYTATKAVLATSIPNPMMRTDPLWTRQFNINSSHSNIHRIESQWLLYIIHQSPSISFFYLLLVVFFILAITKMPPFNTYRNQLERYSILVVASGSFLLFLTLFFLSPGNQFRHFLTAIYSAQISFILFLRAILKKSFRINHKKWSTFLKKWKIFIMPRAKFFLIIIIGIPVIALVTKHNKLVLKNHFGPLLLNNEMGQDKVSLLENLNISANNKKIFMTFIKNNMIFYQKQKCNEIDKKSSFFMQIFPQNSFDLYLPRIFYGYDEFNFNFVQHGIIQKIQNMNKYCAVLAYLPEYKIKKIITGQKNKNGKIIWKTDLKLQHKS